MVSNKIALLREICVWSVRDFFLVKYKISYEKYTLYETCGSKVTRLCCFPFLKY